jgi:hypothetical protein
MPRLIMNVIPDRKVQALKDNGKYAYGQGLYLLVNGERRSRTFAPRSCLAACRS